MTRYFFTLVLLLSVSCIYGQQLNKLYNISKDSLLLGHWGQALIVNSNNYLIANQPISIDANLGLKTANIQLISIDKNGQKIDDAVYPKPDSLLVLLLTNQINKVNDTSYLSFGILVNITQPWDSIQRANLLLIWQNLDLSFQKTKQIKNTAPFTPSNARTIDSFIYVVGDRLLYSNAFSKAVVKKYTMDGILVWEKEIPNYQPEMRAYDVVSSSPSSIMLATRSINKNNSLVKMDTAGNILWHKQLWNNESVVQNSLQKDDAGNIYYASVIDSAIEIDDEPKNGLIAKFDSNGNYIWRKYFNNEPGVIKAVWSFRYINDNKLFLTGVQVFGSYKHGWASLIDTSGKTIWEQSYRSCDSNNFFNYLTDGLYDSSLNQYIMVGSALDCNNNNFQSTWFLRTDSMGCVLQNCAPLSNAQHEVKEDAVSIYPNPSYGKISIAFKQPVQEKKKLLFYNLAGQLVLDKEIFIHQSISIDTELPTGMYFVHIDNKVFKLQIIK